MSHYSTDRFCGNQLGVQGISQPIVQESAPFILQVIQEKSKVNYFAILLITFVIQGRN